ncbi:fibronectin type III domain protein [Roseimicrobium gellanilyticum]|uniref:Fibronectin type III domain protein n=1 Tax=Roseimicrobium gellanilyticum TaxID=748857 RepID=A0A366HUG4_9BACT|nr:fibronectin type III domain-containing protein [Roseimicrobium gellanilyticum]RBP47933.1 fibronectin type III domain protein [Roseimicrobium gellanilyticum]
MSFSVPSMNFWRPVTRVAGLSLVLILSCGSLTADLATGVSKKEKEKERRDKDDKKRPEPAYLPEARPVAMRFVAGQSVDIELSAASGTVRQVEFLIRQTPQYGTLSAIRPHVSDSSKAVVTYTHSSPQASLADNFTFACRVADSSWSAPATVTLVGQRMEPKIEVIENPSFGRIFAGEEKLSRVTVRNVGSSPLEKTLDWQEPWSGPATLSVPVGATQEFLVTFRPTKAGEYRQDMVIQPGITSSRVILYGDSALPFSVSPSRLHLDFKETTGERAAMISLVNARDVAVKAEVALPPGLQGPSVVELAPSSRVDVRLYLPENHVEKFSGKVAIKSGDSSTTVDIDAKPTPATMRVVSPTESEIDFGRVTGRYKPTREVVVENRGGESLVVEAKAITPFALEGAGGAVTIEPRQRRVFKVSFQTDRLGPQTGHVELLSGTGRILVPLKVEVEEAKASETVASAQSGSMQTPATTPKVQPAVSEVQPARVSAFPSAPVASSTPDTETPAEEDEVVLPKRTRMQSAMLALLATSGMPLPKGSINPYLDKVRGLGVNERDSSSITVSWEKPSVMPSGWTVELASMAYNQEYNSFVKIWTRYQNWKPAEVGDERIGIRLFALRPGEQYEMRVMGVDREGKFSKPSDPILTSTPDSWRVPAWAWRLMIVGALSLVGYVLFRMRRGDFLVEA